MSPQQEKKGEASLKLTDLERKLGTIQKSLIGFRGKLNRYIENEIIQNYAAELTAHYYPMRDDQVYCAPMLHAFSVDLVVAPILHARPYLWRYNYDDLDLLAQFYKFSQPRNGYYHLAFGTLPRATPEAVERGCELLGINLGEHTEQLFMTYHLPGRRSSVAARVLETLAGAAHDREQNWYFGFLLDPSQKALHKRKGYGKFRYLRRGRQWMALGTAPKQHTIDLRRERVDNIFGYRIEVGSKAGKVRISVARGEIEWAKAQMLTKLESETPLYRRLKEVNGFYYEFHFRRRFANATNWVEVDRWLLRRMREAAKSEPKFDWRAYQASQNRAKSVTYLPHRSNFFWNVREELHGEYRSIWNQYNWPEVYF